MSRRTWTDEQLIDAVVSAICYADVIRALGLSPRGGNFKSIKRKIRDAGLDVSHFDLSKACARGNDKTASFNRIPLVEILVENSTYANTSKLKKRLIEAGLLEDRCYDESCDVVNTWNGKKITLHLDHINGVNDDNRIENIRPLCPNCHSQTDTYAGRNISYAQPKQAKHKKKDKTCADCNCSISNRATRCKPCKGKQQKTVVSWPSHEELIQMVEDTNYSAVGRKLGVSDNAVRKRLKNHKPA